MHSRHRVRRIGPDTGCGLLHAVGQRPDSRPHERHPGDRRERTFDLIQRGGRVQQTVVETGQSGHLNPSEDPEGDEDGNQQDCYGIQQTHGSRTRPERPLSGHRRTPAIPTPWHAPGHAAARRLRLAGAAALG